MMIMTTTTMQECGNDFLIGRARSSPPLSLLFPSPSLSPPSPLSHPPFPFPSLTPLPFPLSPPYPLEVNPYIAAKGSGGALKLPQRVRAEPGRQTGSGAF